MYLCFVFSSVFYCMVIEKQESVRNYVLHTMLEVLVISQIQKHISSPLAGAQHSSTCKEKEQQLQRDKIKLRV